MATTPYKVTYNGIELHNISKITEFTQRAVMSEDGTQVLYTHVVIGIQCLLNSDMSGFYPSNVASWRATLMQPRKPLIVEFNGNIVLQIEGRDAVNGPTPNELSVVKITGKSVLVFFRVEADVVDCAPGTGTQQILSNRWSETVEIDEEGYSTVTTNGKLICSGEDSSGVQIINADTFRDKILPVTNRRAGFVRTSNRFSLSSDGLTLDWTITEKEKYAPPTDKITKWGGSWEESVSTEGSGESILPHSTLSVWAVAPKNVKKTEIMDWISRLVDSRIDNESVSRIVSSNVRESLDENRIDASVTVIMVHEKNDSGRQMSSLLFKKLDLGDTQTETDIRGTALILLTAQQLFGNSCVEQINAEQSEEKPQSKETEETGEESMFDEDPFNPSDNNDYSAEHIKNPYLYYRIEARMETKNGVIGPLPLLSSSNTQAQFCNVHAPVTKKIVRFAAERIGDIPKLPSDRIDDNHVLLETWVDAMEPTLMANGETKIYGVRGEMIFGLKTAFVYGQDDLKLPKSPVAKNTSSGSNSGSDGSLIASSDYSTTILTA